MITSLHVACTVYRKAGMSPTMAATDLRVSNSLMSKHILTDAPASHNARCLDGSPPGYYMRYASAPENATKYVVYFQGGGWCTSAAAHRNAPVAIPGRFFGPRFFRTTRVHESSWAL